MATTIPMRLTLKGNVVLGSTLQATLAIGHPMESGFRTLESGQRVPQNVIERITASLDNESLFDMETSIGISAHPYLVFPITLPSVMPVNANGGTFKLRISWMDDQGQRGDINREMVLQAR
jgi:sulfur-oxidizing protein SoxZ